MWLDENWMQSGLDALRATLDVDGRTRNQMIEFLFEEGLWDRERLSHPAAIARWNACLNPNKPEFFKLTELWVLMKRFQRHTLFVALARDLGYQVHLVPTEERRQLLLERIVDAQERCAQAVEQASAELERLEDTGDRKSPHPGLRAPGPHFDLDEDTYEPSRGPF